MRNPLWNPRSTINCRGKLISLKEPIIMGILNSTPDSFYNKSRLIHCQDAVDRAGNMIDEGVHIVDVGGYSSRPGALEVTFEEELDRVLPFIEAIHKAFPDLPISVDTFRSKVARAAIGAGAGMINDISGGDLDDEMWHLIAELQIPYVLMHMQGAPSNMQFNPQYQDVTVDILDYFIHKISQIRQLGIHDLIIDPGFGFGKTTTHNFELLRNLHSFRILGAPLLIGLSRKSLIWKSLGINATQALNGTSALHMVALQQGVNILRVHDVAPAREVIQLWQLLNADSKYTATFL